MAKNPILGSCCLNLPITFSLLFLSLHCHCSSYDGVSFNSFTISSFRYSRTEIKPYEWRYIRVDLPPWFSSMSISLESDVDLDLRNIKILNASKLPMICLREGSPPLPDSSNISSTGLVSHSISNGFFGNIQRLRNGELCYPMQKNISVKLTNEQIPPGVWYWGLFNGIGPTRTQSKMINRGPTYSFNGNISVEGCATPTLWGPNCNQTVNMLSCSYGDNMTNNISDTKVFKQTEGSIVLYCGNSYGNFCHEVNEPKIYSLDILGISEQLTIRVRNVTVNSSGIVITCYARCGALPTATLHDYSANISDYPLVIHSPKVGRWYFAIHTANLFNETGGHKATNVRACFSLDSLLHQCPDEKAGLNCTWQRYTLQTILRKNPSTPFESYYLPTNPNALSDSANFPLEPLMSNSSYEVKTDFAWTYFIFDIPCGAAGGNLHIRLNSDAKVDYGIYVKFGGLPSLDSWDYYYANATSNSNGSMFFKLYDSGDELVSFYIIYARSGTWGIGMTHLNTSDSKGQTTTMSISLERCPKRCSSHGSCQTVIDASGLSLYSYCACDRNHGGFDCSVEIVSHKGHMWQSISLIASNAAAVLPAYLSLRRKAFAEWVLFMSSGISSGIYHACDVGTWCPLSYHVLQFMDFWLSFMAVVSTFVYLADISEVSKRGIHTVVAIVTALLAENGPTRSTNIVVVVAIGALGLLIGWLIEFCTRYRSLSLSINLSLNILERWEATKEWLLNFIKALVKRFRWGFLLAAFTALAMAAISWTMESNESYWIWHSLWHISIYTSSFLFLCSKAKKIDGDNQTPPHANYVLTRQDSSSRG